MKNKVITTMVVMVMVLTYTNAQRPKSFKQSNKGQSSWRSELSQEQQDQLKAKFTAHQMAIKADKNKLNELMAKKRTIETTDPVDKDALYKCLASINSVKSNIQKQSYRHQQDVKSLLNEEQVLAFDSKQQFGKRQGGMRDGAGNNRGQGKGYQLNNNTRGQGKGQGQRSSHAMKQGKQKNGMRNKLDLSDEQIAFMKTSRLDMMKTQQGLSNQLNELSAQLKSATSGLDINLKNVDKLIDQQSKIKLQMAQNKADHTIEVRSQLTDEQKLMMDSKHSRGRRMAMR